MRWFLLVASILSLITSVVFLFLFPLPHSPDMPCDPTWQEVGPDILSKLYDDMEEELWQKEGDSRSKLLTSVSNVVGSLGYDMSTFYMSMAPYWNTLITIINIFCFLMILIFLLLSSAYFSPRRGLPRKLKFGGILI